MSRLKGYIDNILDHSLLVSVILFCILIALCIIFWILSLSSEAQTLGITFLKGAFPDENILSLRLDNLTEASITLSIDNFLIAPTKLQDPADLSCTTGIYTSAVLGADGVSGLINPILVDGFCAHNGEWLSPQEWDLQAAKDNGKIHGNLSHLVYGSNFQTFIYPFDTAEFSFIAIMSRKLITRQGISNDIPTIPSLMVDAIFPGWSPSLYINVNKYKGFDLENEGLPWKGNSLDVAYVTLKLQRPLAFKILPIAIFILIITLITILIFVDLKTSIEIMVGILFSIWGLRNVVIPSEIKGLTLIDMFILASYMLLLFAFFVRLIIKPLIIHYYSSKENSRPELIKKNSRQDWKKRLAHKSNRKIK